MTLVQLLIVAWLPGAVIFRLPIAGRDKRAALDAEERLFWAIVISLAVSLSAVLALAFIERYSLERLLIADLAIAGVLALAARFRLRLGAAARRPGLSAVLPLTLVLLGFARFFPPSEYVIGGKDPGVYVNAGIQIAQRGAIVVHDPVVSSVPPFARDLFFHSYNQPTYYSIRFMGFFIQDPVSGTVVSQFPHLFPASIAIGYGIDGLSGARDTTGAWTMLGLLALYFVGARLIGRTAAWAAAAMLGLHVIEVWFSRYPNTEVVMQAFLLAAVLAADRAYAEDDGFFAPISGALLGLLLFLRFDAVLGIGAVVATVALCVCAGGRVRWSFLLALATSTALATAYLLGPMRAYSEKAVAFFANLQPWMAATLIAAGILLIAALAVGARLRRLDGAVRRFAPAALTAAVFIAAVYALWFRVPAGALAAHDAFALRSFTSFYVTLPVLLAALAGFGLYARQAFWRAPALFLTAASFAFFFFYKIRIVPNHFWMTRRYLPIILPCLLLFAAGVALGGMRRGPATVRMLRSAIGLIFVFLIAFHYNRTTQPILGHVEYAGVIPRLEKLAGAIGDRDLLLVESRNSSDTHVLGLPLAYIYARNVLLLDSPRPSKTDFALFLEWARTQYARVLFMGGGGTDLLSPAWGAKAILSDQFQVPEYEASVDTYPRSVRQKEFDYSIYELTPPDPLEASRPFDLDVGIRDDLHVVRFHAKETSEGRTFRWSRDTSYVSVTGVQPASREVSAWLSDGGRPAAAGPCNVTMTLDDEVLGTVRVETGFKPYALAIPPALAGRIAAKGVPVSLKLTTTTWNPSEVLGTGDARALGVMVDRVAVR